MALPHSYDTAVPAELAAMRAALGIPDGTVNGWTPLLAVVSDGDRRVLRVADWTGGEGTKPATGKYVGASGLVTDIGDGVDVRGATGVGTPGGNGNDGWSPVLAVVADGERRVLQISDWTGGAGTKPTTGKYLGASGLVTSIGDAVDVRGASGASSGGIEINFVQGLTLSNNATDAVNDIDIAPGAAQAGNIYVANAATMTKRLDANWAAGNNAGGLDTGTKANSTTYHLWALRKTSDGSFDALFSLSPTAPTVPSGYTKVQRLGLAITDGAGSLRPFKQTGNVFRYNTAFASLSADAVIAGNSAKALRTFSLPTGIRVLGIFNAVSFIGAGDSAVIATFADGANTSTEQFFRHYISSSIKEFSYSVREYTNTAAQIYVELLGEGGTPVLTLKTLGWEDYQIPRIGR